MSLNPASENPKSVFRAADIVLDCAYQGIDAKEWHSLVAQARSANVQQFIADLFAGKHLN
jgi:glucose-6-phosphate isomerase